MQVSHILLSGLLATAPVFSAQADSPGRIEIPAQLGRSGLVFVSDTQQPIWVEKLWLKETGNRAATQALFESIARQPPEAVFHAGDIVASGSSNSDWQDFWNFFTPVSRLNVPFYVTRGNHEFMFFAGRARRIFREHFPKHQAWRSVISGPVAVVLLDSNFSELGEKETADQNRWLNQELTALDQNPKILAVILLTHYSPFTNSTVVSPSKLVQKHFVPPYLTARKTKLLISGHAHAFEHFRQQEKDFLVIGGSGGLLQPLLTQAQKRFTDFYPGTTEKRFFHYLKVSLSAGTLTAEVFRFDPATTQVRADYTVTTR